MQGIQKDTGKVQGKNNELICRVDQLTNEVILYQYLRTMTGPPAATTSSPTWIESFKISDK